MTAAVCAGCGHRKADHVGGAGECCATTDERGLVYCTCSQFMRAAGSVLAARAERLAVQQAAATEAMNAAVDAADTEGWLHDADMAIRALVAAGEPFTTDDVWDWLAVNRPGLAIREPRALGGMIRGLRRRGALRTTGNYRPSHRRHGAPVPEYVGA